MKSKKVYTQPEMKILGAVKTATQSNSFAGAADNPGRDENMADVVVNY